MATHITPVPAAALPLLARRSSVFAALPMATHIINQILAGVHILFVQAALVLAPHSLTKAALLVGLAPALATVLNLVLALLVVTNIQLNHLPHVLLDTLLPTVPILPLVTPKLSAILPAAVITLTNATKPKPVLKSTVLDILPPNQATLVLPVAMMAATVFVTKPVLTLVSLLVLLQL